MHKLSLFTRAWRFAFLLVVALPVAIAAPLSINSFYFDIIPPDLVVTGSAMDKQITGVSSTGWSVSGEICVDGYCGGGSGPQSGTPSIRFTNMDIHCTLVGASCAALQLRLDISGTGGTPGTTLVTTLSADGSVTNNGSAQAAFQGWGYSSSPNSLVEFNLNGGGPFLFGPQSASTGYNTADFGGHMVIMVIQIASLTQGSALLLPDSLVMTFDNPSPNAGVPEPSTLLLVAGGLAIPLARRLLVRGT